MDHLPYVAAAYGLALLVIAWLVTDLSVRTARARRRLSEIDPRGGGPL